MKQTLELFHPKAQGLGQFFSELFDCEVKTTTESQRVVLDLPGFSQGQVAWTFNSDCTDRSQTSGLSVQLNVVGDIFETFDELHQKLEFLRYKNREFASLFQLNVDRTLNVLSLSLGRRVVIQLV